MKTKAEIVQRLLEEKKIDAQEAVVLLMGTEKEFVWVSWPQYPAWPINVPSWSPVVMPTIQPRVTFETYSN